ncbi:MAG TPA: DMT family transporter [Xanthobacteraceae bacterium]|nr:DMT family transporter [Xanthobacteraceae bacterium]
MSSVIGVISPGLGRIVDRPWSPALALTLAALLWSGNFVAGRALRAQVDPLTLNFARWLIALVILAPFVWRDVRANFSAMAREWRLLLALAATGIAAFHTLTYLALETTTATNALLILSTAPMAILLGATTIGAERPHARQVIGIGISVAGAAILIARGDLRAAGGTAFNPGDLWMCASVVLWAAYSLLLRRRPPDLPHGVAFAGSIAIAVCLMAPLVAWRAGTPLSAFASLPILVATSYMALFASVIAFLFWSVGVARLGPTRAGQFINLMPLFGAALALPVLGEVPHPPQVAGAVLVLGGIALVQARSRA